MIPPQLRVQLNVWLEQIAIKLNLSGKKVLEIGIGGDEKPSGSYKFFGKGNEWTTMDKEFKWKPDIIADICNSGLPNNSYDMVIMTQTLEHIWDYKKALSEIYGITKQYAIIDCPYEIDFHQDLVRSSKPWQEWDDYHRLTPAGLRRALLEAGFEKVDIMYSRLLTIAVCSKF